MKHTGPVQLLNVFLKNVIPEIITILTRIGYESNGSTNQRFFANRYSSSNQNKNRICTQNFPKS